ncbi:MAG TPA: alanine--tRNA ligase [Candidatus Paceibacterota bacterium]|nr:alanine--tRNA ligase [Candidatus Paceibacterota bacterium]
MTHQDIRTKFLEFFRSKGHAAVPSSSLLPTDPSVLFTTAGMQQFKPYYTGSADPEKDFESLNTVSIQKCLRTSDIDEVGDGSHLTFFEMLGNFSFGGYWKKEAISYAHEFITKEMGLAIDSVSVFAGDETVPMDAESESIWQSIDPNLKIVYSGRADNFWGPTGEEGPCGPTTEIYVNGLEVWNIVFNEFYKTAGGQYKPLQTKGIDTGMGLERLAMVVQKKQNIFETDLFDYIFDQLPAELEQKIKRVIADHSRAIAHLIHDGATPNNKDQGYVLRRLIRRIAVYQKLYYEKGLKIDIYKILESIAKEYGFNEADDTKIADTVMGEIEKFSRTLERGIKELEKSSGLDDASAFRLYESFGLPFEVIKEVAGAKAEGVTREGFEAERKRHQDISRAGAEKKFGGHGIIKEGDLTATDAAEMAVKTRLHTATHLLQAALRAVLGPEVRQNGSDITAERLRFDFNFSRKLTDQELLAVQGWVNDLIIKDVPVTKREMSSDEALRSGALAFFKQKYPERVTVYSIGEYSKELCGGPHVSRTGEIGIFTIKKEEAVSAGIRRIRAVVN